MIIYTTSKTDADLEQILALQKNNLPKNLSQQEIDSQGFVTVSHDFEDLKKMNDFEQSIVAKKDDKVVAYFLAMTEKSKFDIPVLIPMFEIFEKIKFKGKEISAYNYMVVGQVCVGYGHRGLGIFDACYKAYRQKFQEKYDFAITEIVTHNLRSLSAHKRVGFVEIHKYIAPDGLEWSIVIWDWNNL